MQKNTTLRAQSGRRDAHWCWVIAACCVSAVATAQSVPAPQGSSDQLEEVVVNAQRRQQNLQDVPIVVEAFSAADIASSVITSNTDLGMVTPGLVSASQFGYYQPHLRGIGTTAPSSSVESPVAVYVDGVYYGAQAGTIFSLAGIDSIEVDKGPQGTLFGANGFDQPYNIGKQGGVSLKYDHDFGFAPFESLTAYLRSYLYSSFDGTLVVDPNYLLNIALQDVHSQVTQEFSLKSAAASTINWSTGVYLYKADAKYDPVILTGGYLSPFASFLTYSNSTSYSAALYAQASEEIASATTLTLGTRYTYERKIFDESQFGVYPDSPPALGASRSIISSTTMPWCMPPTIAATRAAASTIRSCPC